MKEEEFERRCQCKRQLEGAGGEGGVAGKVKVVEEVARRRQQKQCQVESQVQREESAQEGAAGESAGGGAPHARIQTDEAQEEYEEWVSSWGGQVEVASGVNGRAEPLVGGRSGGLPLSLSHCMQPDIDGLDNQDGLTAWRRQQRQPAEGNWSASSSIVAYDRSGGWTGGRNKEDWSSRGGAGEPTSCAT